MLRAQCHCRPCAYFSGGAANMFMLMPPEGFRYTAGAPGQFKRDDLERAVTREFCGDCGTHLLTRRPGLRAVILKAGTFDDPSQFGMAQMAINTRDRQAFNCIAEGLPTFEELPPR
ncbi:MAG: GFA family protein [Hyphomicrobiales bacterium]|nr:GFA family protein [Hyphomicrobiales bacterium]